MTSTVLVRVANFLVLVFMVLLAEPSYAVQGSIKFVGQEADQLAGTSITLNFTNGEVLTGRVVEDDDDDKATLLLFDTRTASGGSVRGTVTTPSGNRSFEIDNWSTANPATIDLDLLPVDSGAAVSGVSGMPGSTRRVIFAIGIGPEFFDFDNSVIQAEQSRVDLETVLLAGLNNIVTSANADDSGVASRIDASLLFPMTELGGLSIAASYTRLPGLDESVSGSADSMGVAVEAFGAGQTDYELITLGLGWRSQFSPGSDFGWRVGGGWTRIDMTSGSAATISANGQVVAMNDGFEKRDDNAAFGVVGLTWALGPSIPRSDRSRGEVELSARHTTELLLGKPYLSFGVTARISF